MFGHIGAGELLFVLLIWLIPLAIAFWLLRALAGLLRNVERIAVALEQIAATRTQGQ